MVLISLTAIPPRFAHLTHTIQSLLNQDVAAKVVLTIPKTYRRKFDPALKLPDLPREVQVLEAEADLGPATKLLPLLATLDPASDQPIVYCDDDRLYHKTWLRELMEQSAEKPDCCITHSGNLVRNIDMKHKFRTQYPHKLVRWATLGLYKPWLSPAERQFVDIARGFSGVLVKPRFFGKMVFDVPPELWAVDDVWISGNLAVNKVKIVSLGSGRRIAASESETIADLRSAVLDGRGRIAQDKNAVEYFRRQHGIWQAGQ